MNITATAIALSLGFTALWTSSVSASIRTNETIQSARTYDPAEEVRCLEAFINSDFNIAHNLCLSLAQKGVRDAQLVTGIMYALGEGVDRNADLAKLWLMEAERNGSADARVALAEFKLK